MSGKPSEQTSKAVAWLKDDPSRSLFDAIKKFTASRLSILVQLGYELLKKRK